MINPDQELVATLPACGYKLAFYDQDRIYDPMPVLAFLLFKQKPHAGYWPTILYPVVAHLGMMESCNSDGREYVLIRPNGEVEAPDGETYKSVAHYQERTTRDLQQHVNSTGDAVSDLGDGRSSAAAALPGVIDQQHEH